MCSKTTPTNNVLDLMCVKDFDSDEKVLVILPDTVNPNCIYFLRHFIGSDFEVLYQRTDLTCPLCGSDLNKDKLDGIKPNKLNNVKRRFYKCSNPDCAEIIKTDLSEFIPENSNYTHQVHLWKSQLDTIGDLSIRKQSELFKAFTGGKLPKSTVFEHYNKESDEFIQEENKKQILEMGEKGIKASGDFHHDEQYTMVSKDKIVRLDLLDAHTNYPYYTLLVPFEEFSQETLETYWHTVLDDLPKNSLTTDGYKAYDKIIDNFDITHHRCVFHIMQNTVNDIIKLLRKYLRSNKSKNKKLDKKQEQLDKKIEKYEPRKGRIPDNDTKRRKLHDQIEKIIEEMNEIKDEIKETQDKIDEIRDNIKKISNIFKSNKLSTAKSKLTRLRSKIDQLPDEIVKSINRIYDNFDKLTNHLSDENIPSTNNKIELYFKTTLPKQLKKRYRTIRGLQRRVNLARIRWIHRNVLHHKTPTVSLLI